MSVDVVRDLFNRWERVWNHGHLNLVPECVADIYIRHDESGTRRVTAKDYAQELAAIQNERPGVGIVVFDHEIASDSAWFRFNITWTDKASGEFKVRSGLQQYRIEHGKLAETWIAFLGGGASWADTSGQENWTVKRK